VAGFYDILGIPADATAAQIRQAYLKLARERHPDRFPDAAEKEKAQEFFKQLSEAFNTLSNERTRQQYDAERAGPKLTAPAEIAADAHQRGLQKLEERDFHEAVNLLRTAVHHDAGCARYHADLGRALANNPHWVREAADAIDQAIKLEPRNATFHYELARLLAGQGLRLRARRAADTAVSLAPGNKAYRELAASLGDGPPAGRKP
jgi:curved DNA-binding protein CbpA